jgi:ABC-type multidrug transport system fused ATPase/permease subunit
MAKMWRGGSVMGREDRVGRRARRDASKDVAGKENKGPKVERLRALWPELRALIGPRRNLLLLGLVLIAINRVTGLVLPATTRYVIDDVIGKRRVDLLLPILGAVVGATVVQALTSFALTQTLSKAAQKLIADLRRRVQAHIGRLPVAFYDANKTGNLVSRIMSDVEGVRNLVGTGLVEFLGGLLAAAVALVLMLRISPAMTGVTVFTSVAFAFVLFRAFATMRPIFRERGKIQGEVTGRLTESLGGVRVVKGYHAEAREEAVFSSGVGRLLENILKTLTATSALSLASTLLLGVVGAAVLYVGARQILAGSLTVGGLFTYTMLLGFLIAPVFQVVAIGTQLTEALAGMERTQEILHERPEDVDPRRTVVLGRVEGRVAFEDVTFSYDGVREVLGGISFRSEPGTATALVGPSGSGKSTIIGLIAAFHVPRQGVVTVDGIDLSTVRLDSYRSQLGVVLQDTFLFDGTIRENVAFSRPEASEEDVLRACRLARVDEFAEQFEEGYETIVGERGVKLSGGQRQRVSIARAILADPRILILDEATSSLDSESEALIQEGLAHLMKGRTTFVIAHRLSTIRRAEQILVVEAGRVVERGTHGSLYAAHGRYYDMYTRQHGVESNLFLARGEGDKVPAAAEEEAKAEGASLANPLRLLGR